MDDKLELKEGSIWILQDIKKVFQELYDHYRKVVNENEYLREENKRIKSDAYKDEELTKMKEEYERMKTGYYNGFPISDEEHKRIDEWMDKIMEKEPDMKINCVRFHYEFHPTPLGVAGWVVDSITGEKFQFQELD